MSLISIEFSHMSIGGGYEYTIVDSEFGRINVSIDRHLVIENLSMCRGLAVVKAYSERNLPVGKHLALAAIYLHSTYGWDIEDNNTIQDEACPRHISNWSQYAKERDYHLEKLLPLL